MSQFDELVLKYRTMNYGNLQSQNPSAVSSLLDDYNDRKYFTSHLDGMDNRWVRDAQGNLQFSTPGGLLESGTGTGYATYDPSVDYGDPGYAEMFQPSSSPYAYQGTTINRGEGGGRDRGIGDSNIGYEKINNSWYKINRLTGEVTKTDPSIPGFLGMAISAMPSQNISNMLDRMGNQYGLDVRDTVVEGMIAHEDFRPNPHIDVSFSSEPEPMPANLGLQAYNAPNTAPPTTGDPKPGAPFGQPMGGNQNGGGGNFGGDTGVGQDAGTMGGTGGRRGGAGRF